MEWKEQEKLNAKGADQEGQEHGWPRAGAGVRGHVFISAVTTAWGPCGCKASGLAIRWGLSSPSVF